MVFTTLLRSTLLLRVLVRSRSLFNTWYLQPLTLLLRVLEYAQGLYAVFNCVNERHLSITRLCAQLVRSRSLFNCVNKVTRLCAQLPLTRTVATKSRCKSIPPAATVQKHSRCYHYYYYRRRRCRQRHYRCYHHYCHHYCYRPHHLYCPLLLPLSLVYLLRRTTRRRFCLSYLQPTALPSLRAAPQQRCQAKCASKCSNGTCALRLDQRWPSNAMTSSEERTSAKAAGSRLPHRGVTDGLHRLLPSSRFSAGRGFFGKKIRHWPTQSASPQSPASRGLSPALLQTPR